ncbi:MAG: hypothetical protein NTV06_08710, partial [candidate division Zixibacteria bacterium]|nr:hypothetical protein [candidate division Zixibacteria bacterium]
TFEGDMTSKNISQNNIDLIINHTLQAAFVSTITNHLPLGISVSIHLGGNPQTLRDSPQLVIGPIDLAPGVVGTGNMVRTATETENTTTLDSVDMKVFANTTLYALPVIDIAGSDGQIVRITGNDYVSIRSTVNIEYEVDDSY